MSIRWANIESGREDNFAKYSRGEVSTLQLPYDTESILHYSSNAFSRLVAATAAPPPTPTPPHARPRVYWPVTLSRRRDDSHHIGDVLLTPTLIVIT